MFVITGGGTGIGKALAEALAERDQQVLIVGRREECLKKVAAFSPLIDYVCADLVSTEGRERVSKHLEGIGSVRALIHNAGTIEPILPLHEIDTGAWKQVLATNVDVPLFLTQLLYAQLVNGRVLHIGSGAAYFPVVGWGAYCVSKAALSMLTRCWQLEESDRIAFASVMPGIIDTDMQALIRDSTRMEEPKLAFFKRLKHHHQLLTPETVAAFLCWLLLVLSPKAYQAQEWDIYDKTHHKEWLEPPYTVPHWEELSSENAQ